MLFQLSYARCVTSGHNEKAALSRSGWAAASAIRVVASRATAPGALHCRQGWPHTRSRAGSPRRAARLAAAVSRLTTTLLTPVPVDDCRYPRYGATGATRNPINVRVSLSCSRLRGEPFAPIGVGRQPLAECRGATRRTVRRRPWSRGRPPRRPCTHGHREFDDVAGASAQPANATASRPRVSTATCLRTVATDGPQAIEAGRHLRTRPGAGARRGTSPDTCPLRRIVRVGLALPEQVARLAPVNVRSPARTSVLVCIEMARLSTRTVRRPDRRRGGQSASSTVAPPSNFTPVSRVTVRARAGNRRSVRRVDLVPPIVGNAPRCRGGSSGGRRRSRPAGAPPRGVPRGGGGAEPAPTDDGRTPATTSTATVTSTDRTHHPAFVCLLRWTAPWLGLFARGVGRLRSQHGERRRGPGRRGAGPGPWFSWRGPAIFDRRSVTSSLRNSPPRSSADSCSHHDGVPQQRLQPGRDDSSYRISNLRGPNLWTRIGGAKRCEDPTIAATNHDDHDVHD